MPELVHLEHLSKTYREGERQLDVLRDVELTLDTGELIALLGRSGSGKSTLLNLCAGIDAPSSGRVCVRGVDLGALSEHERTCFRRRHIGLVFQFFHLLPTLTVEENVMLPLDLDRGRGRGRGDPEDQGRTRARALLDRVGLADRAASFPDVLSGGEQQRVCLARALVHEPSLVLADEPTGNLDEQSAEVVLDLLHSLCRAEDRAVLIATHSRRAAARADRVLRLESGALCAVGVEAG